MHGRERQKAETLAELLERGAKEDDPRINMALMRTCETCGELKKVNEPFDDEGRCRECQREFR